VHLSAAKSAKEKRKLQSGCKKGDGEKADKRREKSTRAREKKRERESV
jgi:hypothetical protein